jgi:hypothetical protein
MNLNCYGVRKYLTGHYSNNICRVTLLSFIPAPMPKNKQTNKQNPNKQTNEQKTQRR